VDIERLLDFIEKEMGVMREEILGGGRRRGISEVRSVFCYLCLKKLGMTGRQVSEVLQMSPGGIHIASIRGQSFLKENPNIEESITTYLNN